jgi:hypothetical protein
MGYAAQGIPSYQVHVPTLTGWNPQPSGIIYRYVLIGKLMHVFVDMPNNGTGNATTRTITLPFAAKNSGVQRGPLSICIDNNAASEGRWETTAGSNILTLLKAPDGAATAWTASNNSRASFSAVIETD